MTRERKEWVDIATIALLLFGGLVFGIGWFVGLGLLWTSDTWSRSEKLLGTLALPGGVFPLFLAFSSVTRVNSCLGRVCRTSGWALSPGEAIPLELALALVPILTATVLYMGLRRHRVDTAHR